MRAPRGCYLQLHAKRVMTLIALATTVNAQWEYTHTFSVADTLGGFDGITFADDTSIVCGVPGFEDPNKVGVSYGPSPSCPGGGPQEIKDKDNSKLYPIDSEFGFKVVDFAGAVQLSRDGDYQEGFVGNILDGQNVVGLKVANTATKTYKAKGPRGSWCVGMGNNAVKCSTEHYDVMEHLLTCHETIPYLFADPYDGEQAIQQVIDDGEILLQTDCSTAPLDNNLFVLRDGVVTNEPYDPTATCEEIEPEVYDCERGALPPNDNTDVLNNLAVSADYSISLKDDGKVLYRWGSLVKRPTDVRLYAKLPLPDEWKEQVQFDGAYVNDFPVYSAYLEIVHEITNNPNDQVRAEDLENEGATGRKPSYFIDYDGKWVSLDDCYEGDGDLIPGEEGEFEPEEIPAGTVLKQTLELQGSDPPFTPSEDLQELFTNAWYTTINRDPFEWSYLAAERDPDVFDYIGRSAPDLSDSLELVSGPRWRLKSNKFGQDIPGLDIPRNECSKPPFQAANLKYQTGEETTTYLNLLDWDEETASPLLTSKGWVDTLNANPFVEVDPVTGVSSNGLPMTEDFDLAIYIKGDKKPTTIKTAKLIIDYEGGPGTFSYDLGVEITDYLPTRVVFEQDFTVYFTITNYGSAPAFNRQYTVNYKDKYTDYSAGRLDIPDLLPGEYVELEWTYQVPPPTDNRSNLNGEVTVKLFTYATDSNPENNVDKLDIQVKKN